MLLDAVSSVVTNRREVHFDQAPNNRAEFQSESLKRPSRELLPELQRNRWVQQRFPFPERRTKAVWATIGGTGVFLSQ